MNFGMNFGLFGTSKGGISYTNCLTPLIQLSDGGYGFDTAQTPTGVISPTHTSDLQLIYSFKFYTDSGDWILQLGDAGNEPSSNVNNGVLQFDLEGTDNILLVWNEANLRYEGNDVATAEAVALHEGIDVCFAAVMVPTVLIWYDFAELMSTHIIDVAPSTPIWTFNSTNVDDLEIKFQSPVGTGLYINDVYYEGTGHDPTDTGSYVVATVSPGDITIQESQKNIMTAFNSHLNNSTGTFPDISENTNLVYFGLAYSDGISGNIPDLSDLAVLEKVWFVDNVLTGYDGMGTGTIFVTEYFIANGNDFPAVVVDDLLRALVDGGTTGAAVIIDLSGGTSEAPTAIGEASVDILRSRGCTVNVSGGY